MSDLPPFDEWLPCPECDASGIKPVSVNDGGGDLQDCKVCFGSMRIPPERAERWYAQDAERRLLGAYTEDCTCGHHMEDHNLEDHDLAFPCCLVNCGCTRYVGVAFAKEIDKLNRQAAR
jgi:hypothetical protein